jgi:hypothetical protein
MAVMPCSTGCIGRLAARVPIKMSNADDDHYPFNNGRSSSRCSSRSSIPGMAVFAVSSRSSGTNGISNGASQPVNPVISPRRAHTHIQSFGIALHTYFQRGCHKHLCELHRIEQRPYTLSVGVERRHKCADHIQSSAMRQPRNLARRMFSVRLRSSRPRSEHNPRRNSSPSSSAVCCPRPCKRCCKACASVVLPEAGRLAKIHGVG